MCVHEDFPEILCGFQEIPKGEPGPPKVTKPHAVVTSPELGRAGGSTQRKHVKGDYAWRSVTFPRLVLQELTYGKGEELPQ